MAAKRSLWEWVKAAWSALFAFVSPKKVRLALSRGRFKRLERAMQDEVTDTLLELLLEAMEHALAVWPGYRRNLGGWKGTLVFCTTQGRVACSAVFEEEGMRVYKEAVPDFQAKVVFKNGTALRSFLRSTERDIFNSLLANDVFVVGNLNYVYKFGFLAKDLIFRVRKLF